MSMFRLRVKQSVKHDYDVTRKRLINNMGLSKSRKRHVFIFRGSCVFIYYIVEISMLTPFVFLNHSFKALVGLFLSFT